MIWCNNSVPKNQHSLLVIHNPTHQGGEGPGFTYQKKLGKQLREVEGKAFISLLHNFTLQPYIHIFNPYLNKTWLSQASGLWALFACCLLVLTLLETMGRISCLFLHTRSKPDLHCFPRFRPNCVMALIQG